MGALGLTVKTSLYSTVIALVNGEEPGFGEDALEEAARLLGATLRDRAPGYESPLCLAVQSVPSGRAGYRCGFRLQPEIFSKSDHRVTHQG